MAIAIVLGIVLVAIALFANPRVPLELTAVTVLALLASTGVLSLQDTFAGFANPTVVFIYALLAMTQGLVSTGIVEPICRQVARFSRAGERSFIVAVMIAVAVFSSLVSNTVTTAAFLPVVLSASRQAGLSAYRVLLPLAYASMLGGTIFLYGTSTNLVMSAALDERGMGAIGFAELTPMALPLCVLGIAMVVWLAPRLLSRHPDPFESEAPTSRIDALLGLRHETSPPLHLGRAALASAIFFTVLVLGSLEVVPLAAAGLGGVLLMIATGCLPSRRALRVDWSVVLLIGSMLALGKAMETSGTGAWLGDLLLGATGGLGPRAVLAALMLATIALSAPMSNQAAALVMLPVALAAADGMGLDARPFAIGVTLSASLSFVTPLEPSCVLVFGPGRYRFSDFLRLGLPVTLILVALLTWGVPSHWPW